MPTPFHPRRRLLLSVMLSALLLGACGKQSNDPQSQANRVYRVGTDAAYAPMEMVSADKQITGFDIDLLRAIAAKGGFEVEFINTPFESIFNSLTQNDRDVLISSITITDKRRQMVDFSEPYFEARQMIVTTQESQHINKAQDLIPLKIGVQSATTGDFMAQKLLGGSNPAIRRFESMPMALAELASGGVDAVIGDETVVRHFLHNNQVGDARKALRLVSDDGFEKEYYGIAVRKGEQELLDKINRGLAAVKADGTYDKLKVKYFGS